MAKATTTSPESKNTGDPAARAASVAANSAPIDFGVKMTGHDLAAERSQVKSRWVQRLTSLQAGVKAGQGETDTFYRIGQFSTATGARTTLNALSKQTLPGVFELETRIVGSGESRTSELWASVPSDVQPEADAA